MINHRRSTSSIMVRSTKQRNEHKRSVSFNTMAEVCYMDIPLPSSASEEGENFDPSELWWTSRDYKNNKRRCRSAARRLSSGSSSNDDNSDSDSDDDCDSRGLERMMDGGESRAQILLAVCAVQREQARHRLDGDVDDPDLVLAEVYGAHCIASQMQAERLGRLDAQEAKTLLVSDWGSPPASTECENIDNELSQNTKPAKSSKKSQKVSNTSERRRRSSSDRVPFRDNLKFSLATVMSRRRHAWI